MVAELNSRFLNADFWSACRQAFQDRKSFHDGESNAFILGQPFPVVVLKDLFQDDSLLKAVKQELLSLNFRQKSNDLYDYWASTDLKNLEFQVSFC